MEIFRIKKVEKCVCVWTSGAVSAGVSTIRQPEGTSGPIRGEYCRKFPLLLCTIAPFPDCPRHQRHQVQDQASSNLVQSSTSS